MVKEYFYNKRDDPDIPYGAKGEIISKSCKDLKLSFGKRIGKWRVARRRLVKRPPRLPGGFRTGEEVYAKSTSADWTRGDKGKVLGSRSRATLLIRFPDGKYDVMPILLSRQRPTSPCLRVSDSDLPDPTLLERNLRSKTGLLKRHFAPAFHFRYTSSCVESMIQHRGGEAFVPPLGYTKLALNVNDKYPEEDWLDKKDGWHVAYHGTRCRPCIIKSIVIEGFKVNGGKDKAANGNLFGDGVYCTPNPEKAEQYAKEVPFLDRNCGDSYLVLFSCRVRPGTYEVCSSNHWLVKDPLNIRPCGVLLKDVDMPVSL